MNNTKQPPLLLWGIVAVGIAVMAALFFLAIPDDEAGVQRSQFKLPDTKKSVYIGSRIPEQDSAREVLILSTTANEEMDYHPSEDIRYEGATPVFLYMKNDTLQILTQSIAQIPDHFNETIPVQQIRLSKTEMQHLLHSYRELGYTRIDQGE